MSYNSYISADFSKRMGLKRMFPSTLRPEVTEEGNRLFSFTLSGLTEEEIRQIAEKIRELGIQ